MLKSPKLILSGSDVTLDSISHIYKDSKGERVAGVTSILKGADGSFSNGDMSSGSDMHSIIEWQTEEFKKTKNYNSLLEITEASQNLLEMLEVENKLQRQKTINILSYLVNYFKDLKGKNLDCEIEVNTEHKFIAEHSEGIFAGTADLLITIVKDGVPIKKIVMDWKSGEGKASYNYQIGTYSKVFDADELYILYFPEKGSVELETTFYNKQAYEKYYDKFVDYHKLYKEKIKDVGVDAELDEMLYRNTMLKKKLKEIKNLVDLSDKAVKEYCKNKDISKYKNEVSSISKTTGSLTTTATKKGKVYLENLNNPDYITTKKGLSYYIIKQKKED